MARSRYKMVLQRFEFISGRSAKYWEIWGNGCVVTSHWGRIGTTGSFQPKTFPSEYEAYNHYNKMIASKMKHGYKYVSCIAAPTKKAIQDIITKPTLPDVSEIQDTIISSPDNKRRRSFKL